MGAPDEGENGALAVNGWSLFGHQAFVEAFEQLLAQVEDLAERDPHGFHHHPASKVLQKVKDCTFTRVPADPTSRDFVGGEAFGGHKHWRRAKHGMPPRYRLFFQFRSDAPKRIIFAWFNSEDTQRKEGAKTDCYTVFVRMVERGDIPDAFEALLKESRGLTKEDRAG
jgi:toxin YhaV